MPYGMVEVVVDLPSWQKLKKFWGRQANKNCWKHVKDTLRYGCWIVRLVAVELYHETQCSLLIS